MTTQLGAGEVLTPKTFTVTRADLVAYADASGDQNPIHQDEEVARSVGLPGVIAHGMYTLALVGRAVAEWTGGAEVVAVIYRPGPQSVEIGSGDNRGQTVRQVNVVRAVRSLGAWTGRPALYDLPDSLGPDEAVAVLVQARTDRRILNGAVLPPR